MSLIEQLFPSFGEVRKISNELSELKTEVKEKDDQIEMLTESLANTRKENARFMDEVKYEHSRELSKKNDELQLTRDQVSRKCTELIEDAARTAETNAVRVKASIDKAVIDARAAVDDEVAELKETLQEALVNEAAAVSLADSQELAIEALQAQVSNYYDVITFLATKLPDVDLTKFNVNVDVAPAQVTVNGGKQVKN